MGVLSRGLAYFARRWDTRQEATMTPFIQLFGSDVWTDDVVARELAKGIIRRLEFFYGEGPAAPFFDGPHTLRLHERLTVIELQKLGNAPDLMGVLMFALMHLLQQFYTDPVRKLQRKLFLCDETWRLLKHPAIAESMEKIVRTYRHLRTSAIFLSQWAKDFDSAAGGVIKDITDAKLFLKQSGSELQATCDLFGLSPAEEALFSGQDPLVKRDVDSTTAYLKLENGDGGVVRLVADPYTTFRVGQEDRIDRLRSQALADTGGDMDAAMAQLLARYPLGVHHAA
jgi:type IV secretory pathway VirB4 component